MSNKFTVKKAEEPYDPDRPYYVDDDEGIGYEDLTESEAAIVAEICNEAGKLVCWEMGQNPGDKTIINDWRWLALKENEQ